MFSGFGKGKNISSSETNLSKEPSSELGGSPNTKGKRKNSGGQLKEKTKVIKKSYTELNNLVVAQDLQCG